MFGNLGSNKTENTISVNCKTEVVFRFYLSTQKKALAKFLKCVNWRHQNEVRQALHLIDIWVPMDVEGTFTVLKQFIITTG